jgi:phosphoribosylaminoimidazolecarboxamide formyltransferase/IMP cyclohydrolase
MPMSQGRAILSVADKTGLARIAAALRDHGTELYATGGTGDHLRGHGIDTRDIAALTGHPTMLNGRVKALHPAVFAGLLSREGDEAELWAQGYCPIGFLIAGIAPVAAEGTDLADMDIGGPAMIRAAIKNEARVVLATAPDDYEPILAALGDGGGVGPALRRRLAQRALERLIDHDAALLRRIDGPILCPPALPRLHRSIPLRYGENPHQTATLYLGAGTEGAARAEQLQGKPPSYTNVLDADAALDLALRFERPAAVIVKHAAPCGVAVAGSPAEAYGRALAADPQSAFGGTVGFNRPLDAAAMQAVAGHFTEAVVAPGFSEDALSAATRRPAMRVLKAEGASERAGVCEIRSVVGGLLVQTRDRLRLAEADLQPVTEARPTQAEIDDMLFALEVVRFVRSNAVVTARAGATLGIGGGQSSRVGAVELACRSTGPADGGGLVLASDSYFPFPDSVEVAAKAGVTAIVQQGGARNDRDVIAAADRLGVSMLFSNLRLFRH